MEKEKGNSEEEEDLLQMQRICLEDTIENNDQMEDSTIEETEKGVLAMLQINAEESLLQLAETGNIKDVVKLLEKGGLNLKYKDKRGQTALHLAAKSLHTVVCQKLVEYDKSLLRIKDRNGNTPLHLSISSGKLSTKLVDFFLSKEANPKALARKRQTSLHIASERGNNDIVKLFINHKVPIGNKDSEEFTALHLAAKNGYTNCCVELFNAGADVNAKTNKEQTPLHLAAKFRFTQCCDLLLKSGADINLQDVDGNTALHLVCSMRTNRGPGEIIKCVTLLLANKADTNILNNQGENAIKIAKKAPRNVLKEFQHTNVNITQSDKKGQTILHNVADRTEPDAVEMVLNICKENEQGVIEFVNQQDNESFTALHYAIQSGNTESCKALVKTGADGNICNSHGNALHMVAEFGHEDICDFLIKKGTKIDVVNSNNMTALQIAAQKGHTRICKLLLNKNSNVMLTDSNDNTALHLAALGGHVKCCTLLAEKNQLSVHKVNKDEQIPLHVAAFEGKHDCCEVLIKNKSELWKKDKEGHSAAYYAYQQNHDSIFLLLVNHPIMGHVERDMDFKEIFRSAIEHKKRAVCEGLIKSDFWEEVLKTENTPEEKKSKSLEEGLKTECTLDNHNFSNIIKAYPDLAKSILDKCQTKDLNKEGTMSTYNFTYIDDTIPNYKTSEGSRTIRDFFKSLIFGWGNINSSWRANHPVAMMRKKPDLISHPVINQWMEYKWGDYGKWLYYFYIFFVSMQFYLLLLYFIKSWTWTTLQNMYQHNQTLVCPVGPRLVGPEVERQTIEKNKSATIIGYMILAFSTFSLCSCIYKNIKISSPIVKFKTVLVLLTGICNILLIINFTQCSRNTHLREDMQWLPGYVSSGFLLLKLIITIGEHPSCSKLLFDFTRACQGAKSLIPTISVIIITSIYYQLSKHITNVTNMEPPTLWIIVMTLASILILLISVCSCKPYTRNRQRHLAFLYLIMDLDVLFPPLRNWSYRKEITIDKNYRSCFNLNFVICGPYQDEDEDENLEVNGLVENFTTEITKMKEQLESLSKKIDNQPEINKENDLEKCILDKFSKMETSLLNEISKIKH